MSSTSTDTVASTRWDTIAQALLDTAKLPPIRTRLSQGLPPGWGKRYKRNIVTLVTKYDQEANLNITPEKLVMRRALVALSHQDAYKWSANNPPTEDLKYFWTDEDSGRILEGVVFKNVHEEYQTLLEKVHQERSRIAEDVDATISPSRTLALLEKKLRKITHDSQQQVHTAVETVLENSTLGLGQLSLGSPGGSKTEKLQKRIHKKTEEVERLRQENQRLQDVMATMNPDSFERYRGYAIDVRTRAVITFMKNKTKYEYTANANAEAARVAVRDCMDRVPEEDGAQEIVVPQPFSTGTSAIRATALSRRFHGADFLMDCEIVADKLALDRHGEAARDTLSPVLVYPPQPPNGPDFITVFGMNTTPRPPADERSWQMVHDQIFKAMYGLEPVEARYIRK